MKSFIKTFAILLAASVILTGCGRKKSAGPVAPAAPEAPKTISALVNTEIGGMYVGTLDSMSPDQWTQYRDQQQFISSEKSIIIAERAEKAKVSAEKSALTSDNEVLEQKAWERLCTKGGFCENEELIVMDSPKVREAVHVTFSVPAEKTKEELEEEAKKASEASKTAEAGKVVASDKPAQRDLTMVISHSVTKEVDGKQVTEWVAFRTYTFNADSTEFKVVDAKIINGTANELHTVVITPVSLTALSGVITERADADLSEVTMERHLNLDRYVAPLSKEELAKREAAAKKAADDKLAADAKAAAEAKGKEGKGN